MGAQASKCCQQTASKVEEAAGEAAEAAAVAVTQVEEAVTGGAPAEESKPMWVAEHEEAQQAAATEEAVKEVEAPAAEEAKPASKEASPRTAEDPKAAPKAKTKAKAAPKKEEAAPAAKDTPKSATSKPAAAPSAPKAAKAKEGELTYDLKITVVSARGLRGADSNGLSDPFVSCVIPGKERSKFSTSVKWATCEPTWNHIVDLIGFHMEDRLQFTVWDKDTFSKSDMLGECTINKDAFLLEPYSAEVKLSKTTVKATSVDAYLTLKIECLKSYVEKEHISPEVRRHEVPSGAPKLMMTFVSARGLRNADWGTLNGQSDPYVICEVPGKTHSRVQTPIMYDTLDPVWNYSAQIADYEVGDSISIAVMDKDVGKSDDVLGRASIMPDKLTRSDFEAELPLADAGKGIKAYVKVKVLIDASIQTRTSVKGGQGGEAPAAKAKAKAA